jgi:hypothetical protein
MKADCSASFSLFLLALCAAGLLLGCQSGPRAEPTVLQELPLERGYYASGGECEKASNATVTLNTGDGINGARSQCSYSRIRKIGDKTYSVSETCHHPRGFSEEQEIEITIENRKSYTRRVGDSTWSSQHCPQERLPEPWRSNDIRQHLQSER